MFETGWVKVHRKLLQSGLLTNHALAAFWLWCLLKASHKPHAVWVGLRQVKLGPGQFVFTYANACRELGLSPQKARTLVKSLKSSNQISMTSTNKFSVIFITNWDVYQSRGEVANTPGGIPNNKQTADGGQAGAGIPYIQECKECEEEKNIAAKARGLAAARAAGLRQNEGIAGLTRKKTSFGNEMQNLSGARTACATSLRQNEGIAGLTRKKASFGNEAAGEGPLAPSKTANDRISYPPDFLRFWEAYPRLVGKKEAYEAWLKIPDRVELLPEMLAKVRAYCQTEQWRFSVKSIPHAATWLNNRRWEDEPGAKPYAPAKAPATRAPVHKLKPRGSCPCALCQGYGLLEFSSQSMLFGKPKTMTFVGYCPQCQNWAQIKGDSDYARGMSAVSEEYLAQAQPYTA